jgi:hypothetical protein
MANTRAAVAAASPSDSSSTRQQAAAAAAAAPKSPLSSPSPGSLKPASTNPLSAWYRAQRNPYAASSAAVSATLSPLHLHLLALRQKQLQKLQHQSNGYGRSQSQRQGERQALLPQHVQVVGGTGGGRGGSSGSGSSSGKPPSFISLVLALYKWCSVIWSRKAALPATPASAGSR